MSFDSISSVRIKITFLLSLVFLGFVLCHAEKGYDALGIDTGVTEKSDTSYIITRHQTILTLTGFCILAVTLILLAGKMRKLKQSKETLEQMNKELGEALSEVKKMSRHDPLTGLPNRRAMLEKIDSEIVRYKRSSRTFVFIMIDIDDFKSVNDRYGHETGDYLLKELASIFIELTREQDMVCRWGGEEFLLLLPETDCDGGFRVAEKIRITVESCLFKTDSIEFNITISSGVTDYSPTYNVHEHVKVVDDAMYQSKRSGKNRITSVSMIRKKS